MSCIIILTKHTNDILFKIMHIWEAYSVDRPKYHHLNITYYILGRAIIAKKYSIHSFMQLIIYL